MIKDKDDMDKTGMLKRHGPKRLATLFMCVSIEEVEIHDLGKGIMPPMCLGWGMKFFWLDEYSSHVLKKRTATMLALINRLRRTLMWVDKCKCPSKMIKMRVP